MLIVNTLLAVLLSVTFSTANAADEAQQYRVRAIDEVGSCAGLTKAHARGRNDNEWGELYGYSLYTMGYITGINRLAPNTYDIAGTQNNKTLMGWLQKYCLEHPLEDFSTALYKLTSQLYSKRTVKAPK